MDGPTQLDRPRVQKTRQFTCVLGKKKDGDRSTWSVSGKDREKTMRFCRDLHVCTCFHLIAYTLAHLLPSFLLRSWPFSTDHYSPCVSSVRIDARTNGRTGRAAKRQLLLFSSLFSRRNCCCRCDSSISARKVCRLFNLSVEFCLADGRASGRASGS